MNKASTKAGLSFNANRVRKRFVEYYSNFKLDKPRFAGRSSTYVFITSMVEQTITNLFEKVIDMYVDNNNKDESLSIDRSRIIKVIESDKEYESLLFTAVRDYDTKSDCPEYTIVTEKNLNDWMNNYFIDNVTLTAPAAIYIRYLINYLINRCVENVVRIRTTTDTKSITIKHCKAAVHIFLGENLYKSCEKTAIKAVKLATEDDSKNKIKGKTETNKKKKKKEESDDENDEDEEDDDDDE
jgi:hypothetical protein